MAETIKFSPNPGNLGENCLFWENGCRYPKAEMQGRTSCEGLIDPVCIYLKDGIRVSGFDLTNKQVLVLKTTIPGSPHSIPAGKPLDLGKL